MRTPARLTLMFGAAALFGPFAATPTRDLGGGGPGPRKLALIVAIGAYDPKSGYNPISSARDVPLVRGALLSQGFDSANIKVIEDKEATKAGMLAGFKWLADQAGPGDVLVFHYSGHGHQITDLNGDELDGLDEMLVPYGAPANLRGEIKDYKGEKHLIDDTLGVILDDLRRRVGPTGDVTFFIDACFSGSATRGAGELPVRGVLQPIKIAGAPSGGTRGSGKDEGSGFDTGSKTRGGDDPSLAPFVVISAAQHDRVAHEAYDDQNKSVGSLSLALSRALPRVDSTTSFRALYERIAVLMNAMKLGDQEPQIEGTVDTRVFNGQAVSQPSYVKVADVIDDTTLIVKAGTLLGLFPGTTLEFRRPGDAKTVPALDSGTVQDASEVEATVHVSGKAKADTLRNSLGYVRSYTYGDMRVKVELAPSLAADLRAALERELRTLPIVELTSAGPDLLLAPPANAARAAGRKEVSLTAAPSNTFLERIEGPTDSLVSVVRERVRAVGRSSYFRRLEMKDPDLKLTMELIPAKAKIIHLGPRRMSCPADTTPATDKRSAGGAWELSPDDVYWIRLHNEGKQPAYFTILDLQSDYSIGSLYPPAGKELSDVVLEPGDSYRIRDCYYATEPYGLEILKLIATTDKVDFTPVLTPSRSTRGVRGPLEQLFADAYQGTRSGGATPAGTAVTFEIPINVVPRAGGTQ